MTPRFYDRKKIQSTQVTLKENFCCKLLLTSLYIDMRYADVPWFIFVVPAETHQNQVQMPDGCNPTNYSGTQINFWGVAPGKLSQLELLLAHFLLFKKFQKARRNNLNEYHNC